MTSVSPSRRSSRCRRVSVWAAAVLLLLVAVPAAAQAPPQEVRLVALTEELKFDLEEFTVTAGRPVVLTLDNPSDMPHNAVITVPGEGMNMTVALEAWSLPDALEREYVPPGDKVLFHTRLVNPGESDTIRFDAPKEPGDYIYVCTVPGHAMTMWGTMHVVAADAAAAHGHAAHAAPTAAPHPYLRDVTYQYFEGDFKKLPDFAALVPSRAGMVETGRLDLPKTPRKEFFAVLIKARLDVPQDGAYTFALRCDDGARIRIDGKNAVTHDGLHPVSLRVGRPLQLTKGEHVVEVGYFNGSTHAVLQAVWSGPGLRDMEPLSADVEGLDLDPYFLKVGSEAIVQRGLMPDSSSRSIAVGLPGGTHYCFDAAQAFVRYGWTGHFLDVGPQHGYGDARGGQTMAVLGETFSVGAAEQPLRIGAADKVPQVEFLGYERTAAGPKMKYRVDGVDVTQAIEGVEGKPGLRFTFELDSTPPGPVFFVVKPEGLELSSSAGEWKGGQLQLAPEAARSFAVTLVARQ